MVKKLAHAKRASNGKKSAVHRDSVEQVKNTPLRLALELHTSLYLRAKSSDADIDRAVARVVEAIVLHELRRVRGATDDGAPTAFGAAETALRGYTHIREDGEQIALPLPPRARPGPERAALARRLLSAAERLCRVLGKATEEREFVACAEIMLAHAADLGPVGCEPNTSTFVRKLLLEYRRARRNLRPGPAPHVVLAWALEACGIDKKRAHNIVGWAV